MNTQLATSAEHIEVLLESHREFLERSSHELRTPLTSVIGYLEGVLDSEGLSEEQRAHIDIAYRNARRLHTLVDDLLLLNETEIGDLPMAVSPVAVHDLLTPTMEGHVVLCKRKGVTLTADPTEHLPDVLVDRARTEQVLSKLLSNALKFTPSGGAIDVKLATRTDALTIAVRDTGMGITPAELRRVFERFFRSDQPAKRIIPGSGLGLPIAHAMAEAQGGSLVVSSIEGQGSTFTLTVPLAPAPIGVN